MVIKSGVPQGKLTPVTLVSSKLDRYLQATHMKIHMDLQNKLELLESYLLTPSLKV
jgi:hypothetical protein